MTHEPSDSQFLASFDVDELLTHVDIEADAPDSAVIYRMLYERSMSALSYTQTLYDLSRRLVGAHHLSEVLDILCEGVKSALNADAVFVVMLDPKGRVAQEIWFDLEHRHEITRFQSGSLHDVWAGLVGLSVRTQSTILSSKIGPDMRESPLLRILRKRTFGLCSIAVAPMRSGRRIIGAVAAINQYPKPDFNQIDVDLISTFGNQAALGIENARLHSEMAARAVDLTQQAEELARSNADLERFAYVASHDLQEPLRVVSSYVELLQRRYGGDLPAEGEVFLSYALDGVNRMRQLINDLLAYSRIGTRGHAPAKVSTLSILQTVTARLAKLIEETDATITHDELPVVLVDESQAEQLMQNLLSNALKFHGAAPPRVHLGVERIDRHWCFSMHDEGIGIDSEQSDRIFQVFQRLHTREEYPGTGIGLAICKRIVERHGGRIWVESKPGEGATFFFTLPALD